MKERNHPFMEPQTLDPEPGLSVPPEPNLSETRRFFRRATASGPGQSDPVSAITRWLAEVAAIATLYFLTGKLGFLLAIPPGNVTLIWIPSGLALAAVVLRGNRIWPGIFVGSFVLNYSFLSEHYAASLSSALMAFCIGTGAFLQAMFGAALVGRWMQPPDFFNRREEVLKFFAIGAVACLIASTLGTTALFFGKLIYASTYLDTWWVWWFGNLIGILVIAPLLMVWVRPWSIRWNAPRIGEAVFLAAVLAVLGRIMFLTPLSPTPAHIPLAFLLIPLAIWAAFRFDQKCVTLLSLVVSSMAVMGTFNGWGPFGHEPLESALPLLQVFLGTLTLTGLILSASMFEQRQRERDLGELSAQKAAMLEVALDCVITADQDGRIIDFNPAAERTFGYRKDEVVGLDFADAVIPPSLRKECRAGMARYLATGEGRILNRRVETNGMRSTGEEFPVEMSVHAVRIGNRSFFASYLRDITERKQTDQARSRLAAIVESSEDAIIGKSLEGMILSWNRGAEKIFGHRADEMVGRSISTLIPADREAEFSGYLARVRRGESIERVETARLRKDGQIIEVALSISPILDSAGRVVGASSIARDITERKHVQERIRHSEERFRAFMDNSPVVAFIKDVAGRYVYMNKPFQEVFGRTFEEIKGKTDFDVWPSEIATQLRANDVAVLNANKTIQMFETAPSPDGVPHHWMVYKFPILDVAGQRLLGGVALDITERRQLEAAREQLRVQYEDALKKIETLSGFLPICASCKRVRDEHGGWNQIEVYISNHSEAEFSHGLCPDCAKKLYPGIDVGVKKPKRP